MVTWDTCSTRRRRGLLHGSASFRLWSVIVLATLPGQRCASKGKDDDLLDQGPALYGDSKYWVLLKDLKVSEGRMEPKFDPKGTDFKIIIENPDAFVTTLFPEVNLPKYDVQYSPEIRVNGKVLKYKITDAFSYPVVLNQSFHTFDKVYAITLRDPHPPTGWFAHGAEHTYNLRIMQAPVFEKVVRAKSIKVFQKGMEIEPTHPYDEDSKRSDYVFSLEANQTKGLEVKVVCQDEATGKKFDGLDVPLGETETVNVKHAVSTKMVQCIYKDDRWTKGKEMQRTYVLTFTVNSELSNTNLRPEMLASQGYCDPPDPKHPGRGFTCRAVHATAEFLVEFNNSHAEVLMVDDKDGNGNRLWNGMPLELSVPKGARQHYTLLLTAGRHKREWPLQVLRPASCHGGFKCPPGYKMKPANSGTARDWLCAAEKCTDSDTERCCTGSPAPAQVSTPAPTNSLCETYQCKDGSMLVSSAGELQCSTVACTSEDEETCCRTKFSCEQLACPKGFGHRPPRTVDEEQVCPQGDPKCADMCCIKLETCEHYRCPAGHVLVPQASHVLCPSGTCLEHQCCHPLKVCQLGRNVFQCPHGKILKEEAKHITVAPGEWAVTQEDCCETRESCSTYTCPKDQALKPSASSILCEEHKCVGGDEDTTCCYPIGSCFEYSCPENHTLKEEAEKLSCKTKVCAAEDASTCCARSATCDSYTCPDDSYVLKDDAESIFCRGSKCSSADWGTCCREVSGAKCSTFECPLMPVPYGLKQNADSIECAERTCTAKDVDTCCVPKQPCSEFTCPANHFKKEYASVYVNEWESDSCCERRARCSYFSCPVGFQLKADAASLECSSDICTDADAGVCCEKAAVRTEAAVVLPIEVEVYPKAGQGTCVQFQGGFWCDATGDTINLEVRLTTSSRDIQAQKLAPIHVPKKGDAAKHLTVTLQSQALTSRVGIWVARGQAFTGELPDTAGEVSLQGRRLEWHAARKGADASSASERWSNSDLTVSLVSEEIGIHSPDNVLV